MTGSIIARLAAAALLAFVVGAAFARYSQPGLALVWLNTLIGCG